MTTTTTNPVTEAQIRNLSDPGDRTASNLIRKAANDVRELPDEDLVALAQRAARLEDTEYRLGEVLREIALRQHADGALFRGGVWAYLRRSICGLLVDHPDFVDDPIIAAGLHELDPRFVDALLTIRPEGPGHIRTEAFLARLGAEHWAFARDRINAPGPFTREEARFLAREYLRLLAVEESPEDIVERLIQQRRVA